MFRSLLLFAWCAAGQPLWAQHFNERVWRSISDPRVEARLLPLVVLAKGPSTPLEDVKRIGERLLESCETPAESAWVHAELAHLYGQAGLSRPELVVDHARLALEHHPDLSRRLTMWVYLGDAERVRPHPATNPQLSRQNAARAYLGALHEIPDLTKLPEQAPPMPIYNLYDLDDPQEEERLYSRQLVERERITEVQRLIFHRDIVLGQLQSLYARPPNGRAELAELAAGLKLDPSLREWVFQRVTFSPDEKLNPQSRLLQPVALGWRIVIGSTFLGMFLWALLRVWRRAGQHP